MPWTPWRSTSSATRKASTIEVFLSSTDSRREFGITMSVSTSAANSSMPSSAWAPRRAPSKENGLVQMPTVSAFTSREMRATIGAAPVPVPPPAPVAMKTMSAPLSSALMSSYSSSAAWRPISGSEPEPSPRVTSLPMWSLVGAAEPSSDWRSVFTAMNSTPSIWASIMRSTALTPAPPTPITRRTGSRVWLWPTDQAGDGRLGVGRHGPAGSRSKMFSGMSLEKTVRRRSSGVGVLS